MSSALAGLARSGATHGAIAFAAMGAWAAFANRDHGTAVMAWAGLAQGAVSCVITLILKRSLEAMAERLSGSLAVIVPPTLTCVVVLGVLLSVHSLAGTPEVWPTISVPYTVSSVYAWIYTAGLALAARRGRA